MTRAWADKVPWIAGLVVIKRATPNFALREGCPPMCARLQPRSVFHLSGGGRP